MTPITKIALTIFAVSGPILALCITVTLANRREGRRDSEQLAMFGGASVVLTWVSAVVFSIALIWGL